MINIDRNLDEVLLTIFYMQKIYIEYLNQANKADNQHDQIQIRALRLKQDLYINNVEREQTVTFIQEQANKHK